MIKYCLPVIVKTKEEVWKMLGKNIDGYSYVEIWVDYIEGIDVGFVNELVTKLGKKLILVFRRKNLEPIKMDLSQRQEILEVAGRKNLFVDLDILTQKEELKFVLANNLGLRLIASYHNYTETPSDEKLDEVISKMMEIKPEVYKISTFCNSKEDALTLLLILQALNVEGVKKIILGMGKDGLITRIFGTLWGNEMTFAPISSEQKSAEGQLTREQFEKVFKALDV